MHVSDTQLIAEPAHTPVLQVSPVVQRLPSEQLVPSVAPDPTNTHAAFWHVSSVQGFVSSHWVDVWQAPPVLQMGALVPVQPPAPHTSDTVQASPSSQAVPRFAVV